MRITQEADYALRITSVLALSDVPVGAPQVAETVHTPARFAMKILRKLALKGIVTATRGVSGGYTLAIPPNELSLKQVIEAIDGEILIRHCLCDEHICSHNADKSVCRFHNVFSQLNSRITQSLEGLTIGEMADTRIPLETLLNKIK